MGRYILFLKNKIKAFYKKIKKCVKNCIINNRKKSLVIAGLFGIVLAILAYCYLPCTLPYTEYRLKTSLVMLILALPTVFLIWIFRTHDVREQIQEARTNNQFNNFANAMKLFVEKENIEANSIGLKLLMKIKHQGLYEKQIDLATMYKDLKKAKLQGADLRGINLHGADLQGAKLQGTDLRGADLQGANLWEAEYDDNTQFPEGLDHAKEHQMAKIAVEP